MADHSPNTSDFVLRRRHLAFAGLLVLSTIIFWNAVANLVNYSLGHESSSHILLIPFVSLYLFVTNRNDIFSNIKSSIVGGASLIACGIVSYLLSHLYWSTQEGNSFLCAATISVVIIWIGGFISCYGIRAARAAAFPLLFLVLLVPLPDFALGKTVHFLQEGSTDITQMLFKMVGVPVLRQGFILSVPGATIEVAEECSGIRSSMAMFITMLLTAHLLLRTRWRIALFVALAIPLAIIKNGIRITTLTLLSIHVDPGFLTGRLHHEGGFVFFLIALSLQFPILLYLRKAERRHMPISPAAKAEIQNHPPEAI